MTFPEFLRELEKTRGWHWWLSKATGWMRTGLNGDCPIQAVGRLGGGGACDLAPDVTRRIMAAADKYGCPATRRKLLRAVGLEETL